MLSRRALLAIALTAGAGLVLRRTKSASAQEALLYCSWVNTGVTRCNGGVLEQKWQFLCCEGIGCDVWDVEWRPIGTC